MGFMNSNQIHSIMYPRCNCNVNVNVNFNVNVSINSHDFIRKPICLRYFIPSTLIFV